MDTNTPQTPDTTETKHVLSSTTIRGILLMLAPKVCAAFGWKFDLAANQEILELIVEGIGAALAYYGRYRQGDLYHLFKPSDPMPPSEVGKQVLQGRASLLILCGLLACGVGCQSLRDKWNGLSPGMQDAAKQAAKLALSFGLSELGNSVKEVRPWQEKLQGIIETTFAKAADAEAIGATLSAQVKASVPEDVQPLVLAKFKESLVNPKVTASGAGGSEFNSKIASRL